MLLFHGCTEHTMQSIIRTKFDRARGLHNETTFGRGVNFSDRAYYSYNRKFTGSNKRYLIVARVIIGESCIGHQNMYEPPTGYDSTGGTLSDGTNIFVSYDDSHMYPEFVIEFN